MRTCHSSSSLSLPRANPVERADRSGCGGPSPAAVKPALLVVSNDTDLRGKLRHAAGDGGRLVVEADGVVEALKAVRSAQLAAVLLDLDLSPQGAWRIADGLLQEEE